MNVSEPDLTKNEEVKSIGVSPVKEIVNRVVKEFMDLVVLSEIKRNKCASGYDIMVVVHDKFGVPVSSGTVYSNLYALERRRLVSGSIDGKKRVYRLTDEGEDFLGSILNSKKELAEFMQLFLNF